MTNNSEGQASLVEKNITLALQNAINIQKMPQKTFVVLLNYGTLIRKFPFEREIWKKFIQICKEYKIEPFTSEKQIVFGKNTFSIQPNEEIHITKNKPKPLALIPRLTVLKYANLIFLPFSPKKAQNWFLAFDNNVADAKDFCATQLGILMPKEKAIGLWNEENFQGPIFIFNKHLAKFVPAIRFELHEENKVFAVSEIESKHFTVDYLFDLNSAKV